MKKKTVYLCHTCKSMSPFKIVINSGVNSEFTIPTSTSYTYDYDINVPAMGIRLFNRTGNVTLYFDNANTDYEVWISGVFPYWNQLYGSGALQVVDIKQWGEIIRGAVQSYSFNGYTNMECSALDSPDFVSVTNGDSMFRDASSFNPLNFAPTLENLTNGANMFNGASSLNPPNFAPTFESLTTGTGMFQSASAFNPPNFAPTLGALVYGNSMFRDASSFNPPNFAPTFENLIYGFYMFQDAINFSQDIYAPNSVNLGYDNSMFRNTKIEKITLNNSSLTSTDIYAFACSQLTDLILIDRKINLWINQAPLLISTAIDNLFTSLGTANPGESITITTAQSTSGIDTTIATSKGWTIVIV